MESHRLVAFQALAIVKRASAPATSGKRSLAIERDGVRFAIALAGPAFVTERKIAGFDAPKTGGGES